MTALLPEGFRDRLPPFADAAARLEAAILGAAYAHGYERTDPALAEFEAGLAGRLKAARAQDAVRFVDPVSQATLAIRPDMTAQIGRIAATRMGHHPRPVRLSYAGRLEPDFALPPVVGKAVMRRVMARQFGALVKEILRRDAAAGGLPAPR
jgi:ATP phosphoribosyltransferase regulatory subunit HisZ